MKLCLEKGSPERCDSAESFLQSGFWGRFKSEFGWTARHFLITVDGVEHPLLVLERSLARGFSFAYVPHGPECGLAGAEATVLLSELSELLRPELRPGCLFIRFDPPWYSLGPNPPAGGPDSEAAPAPRPAVGPPLVRAASDVQPPDTVLLDLCRDEESLLASMKPKWRYNIGLSAKRGVTVEEAGPEYLATFYALYKETALRDRIALHPEQYYRRLFDLARDHEGMAGGARPELRLWLARHEGDTLASIVTLFRGDRAVYLYGASSDLKRNLMPAYALQWAAIRAAKSAGCREYDFFGIPPTADPAHPMAGLYRFKTGFGGRVVHRAGSWDYPLRPTIYRAFRRAEALRSWWFKDFRKRRSGRERAVPGS